MGKIVSLHSSEHYRRKAESFFSDGLSLVATQNYRDAVECFAEASRLDFRNAEYHYYKGLAYYFLHNIEGSIEALREAVSLAPHHIEYRFTYGMSLYRLSDYELAAEEFRAAYRLDSEHEQTVQYLARTMNRLGWHSESLDFIMMNLKEWPHSHTLWFEAGYACDGLQRYNEAIKHLLTSISNQPTHAPSYYFVVTIFSKLDRFDEAIAVLEQLKEHSESDHRLADRQIEALNLLKSM